MKRDKLRIGVITAALAMMIAGGVLTWQQDARKTDKNEVGMLMTRVGGKEHEGKE